MLSDMREPDKKQQNGREATGEGSKRQMGTPQGGSQARASWHRVRVILNSGVESRHGAAQGWGEQYKAHAQENTTQHPDVFFCQTAAPCRARQVNQALDSCQEGHETSLPSQLCRTRESPLAGKGPISSA